MTIKKNRLDLASIRARLSESQGKEYWQALEEMAETEDFQEMISREFPNDASVWKDPIGRRNFLKLMGAGAALAGLAGCGVPIHQPKETIVPYVEQPEEIVLGKPLFFATAMTLGGVAAGLLAESHEGRPTKIEGNPQHPGSLGGTDVLCQASILDMYDPDRAQNVTYVTDIRSWDQFQTAVRAIVDSQTQKQGSGIRLLTETITSPSFADHIVKFQQIFPQAKWYQYDPVGPHNTRAGAMLAFGQYVNTVYRFDKADVVLSLDSDFLYQGAGMARYVRDCMSRRKVTDVNPTLSRLYVIESTPSNTGITADHRLPLKPSEIEGFARAVAAGVGVQAGNAGAVRNTDWVNTIVNDLKQHHGSSLVVVGENQPPVVHALAHAMNQALGNVGTTVAYTDPLEANPADQIAALGELVNDMDSGRVDVLLVLSGNPVFDAPADYQFAARMQKVPFRAHLGTHYNETSEQCHWQIPESHYLESWGDARAYDGTVTMIQPLIAPLYNSKTAYEFLAAFTTHTEASAYEVVQAYWKGKNQFPDFEQGWRKSVCDGFITGTALPEKQVSLKPAEGWSAPSAAKPSGGMEISFRSDPSVYDGRFANNAWLQECPKPITKITWDNVAFVSPRTAEKLGLSMDVASRGGEHGKVYGDMVELSYLGQKVKAPVWVHPGQPDDTVTLTLGYGRTIAGKVGRWVGFNVYPMRTSYALWDSAGAQLTKIGDQYPIACTQYHYSMEDREQIRTAPIDEFRKKPDFGQNEFDKEKPPSLYPGWDYSKGYKWGMTIDLNSCVGCNACVVACQSENNVPVVGKDGVMHGREMHWIRIDRYYSGNDVDHPLDNPATYYQPVPCQQCENAPCELVCPVGATTHSAEGLNDMVYNRCVGTRYCSNNCPYKVRRFNFFRYADWETESLKLMRNPEVTVRSRGVMEKCTYCVQRISHAKIEAEKEGRDVRDGEIATACEAACPANAITFGNINDEGSRVAKLKSLPRNYGLLADLNTMPRTTYLAQVTNPNPDLKSIKKA